MRNFLPILLLILSSVLHANIYETIEVVGKLYTSQLQSRNVVILTEKEIDLLHSDSVAEVLGSFIAVNLNRKGGAGEIYDLSMRGGNFEQVLVLINGIAYNNPQTGHFNSDFPFQVRDIRRIELIKGGSSTTYGNGAYTGVINIILKREDEFRVSVSGGDKGFYEAGFGIGKSLQKFKFRVGGNKKRSDGYYSGREFDVMSVSATLSYRDKSVEMELFSGYKQNDFGAEGFYAPFSSTEEIDSIFTHLRFRKKLGNHSLTVKYAYSNHNDFFILDRTNPGLFSNESRTVQHQATMLWNSRLKRIRLSGGIDFKAEQMDSLTMGIHRRQLGSLFFNLNLPLKQTGIDAGLRTTLMDGQEPNLVIYSGLYYQITRLIKLKFSTGKSFRLPSFTELYYQSPSNRGNRELRNESNLSYEIALTVLRGKHSFDMSVYFRDQRDSIDWVKYPDLSGNYSPYWEAVNIRKNDIAGIEFIHNIVLSNTYLNYGFERTFEVNRQDGFLSKYGLRFPSFAFKCNLSAPMPFVKKLRFIGNYTYKRMNSSNEKGHFLDLKFNLTLSVFKISLKINNLFNQVIEEIPGVKIPGRWAYLQFSYHP